MKKENLIGLENKLKALKSAPHCANCGKVHPEIFGYDGEHKGGLTVCCQENICGRNEEFNFGDAQYSVRACCWAVAEIKFKLKNIDVAKLKGIQRSS